MTPKRRGSVSSTRRAAWPPTRSWMRTKSAPSMRGVAIVGEGQAAGPVERVEHPLGEAADDREPLGVDVEQDELVDRQPVGAADEALDELRGVRAAAADDGDLDAHPPSIRPDVASGLTRLLITLSAIRSRASPVDLPPRPPRRRTPSADGPLPARARSRAAPPPGLPRPASRPRRRRRGAGRPAADRARAGGALRLQPHHRPPRARASSSARAASSAPAGAARPSSRPGSSATSPRPCVHGRDGAARPRSGDATHRGPPGVGRRGGGRGPRPRARLADALRRTAAPGRRRAAAARAGPPAGRAVPGAPGRATSSANRCTNCSHQRYGDPHRAGSRGPRARPAARP